MSSIIYGRECVLKDGMLMPTEHNLRQTVVGDYIVTDFDDDERWVQKKGSLRTLRYRDEECFIDNQPMKSLDSAKRSVQLLMEVPVPKRVKEDDAAQLSAIVVRNIGNCEVGQRQSDGYINATALCKAVGRFTADYFRTAGAQEFMEELSLIVGIPTINLVNIRRGKIGADQGTWVHPDIAIHVAQWCSAKFAVQVSQWVREWLSRGVTLSSGLSADARLPQTFSEALRALADSEDAKERLKLEVSHSAARRDEAVSLAEDLANIRAKEVKAIPLSTWLNRTSSEHGHGPISGLKVLRALGVLHRELVKGCRKTKESAISQKWMENGVLMYSAHDFVKRRKTEQGVCEPVINSNGVEVTGESRVILVTPEGAEPLLRWMLQRPEVMLRRLVRTRPDTRMYRLKNRYSFFEHDSHSWDELNPTERAAGVRLRYEDDTWTAWCNVEQTARTIRAQGSAKTLSEALLALAENYYTSNQDETA
jgi:hypothetical protein